MNKPTWQKEARMMDRVDQTPYSFVVSAKESMFSHPTIHAFAPDNNSPVASMMWNTEGGIVSISVHPEHRGTTLLPAMIKRAHEFSDRIGIQGPHKSDDYTELSHGVMKTLGAPETETSKTPVMRTAEFFLKPEDWWTSDKRTSCQTCGGRGGITLNNREHKEIAEKLQQNPNQEDLQIARLTGKAKCPTCDGTGKNNYA